MRIAIIVHAFYRPLWPELARHIRNFSDRKPDIFVTLAENAEPEFEAEIKADFSAADVKRLPNCGFDVGPFIEVLERIDLDAYDLVVKLHTKRNRFGVVGYRPLFGGQWRRKLLAFCRTKQAVARALALFDDPTVGMVGNGDLILHPWDALVPNPPPIDPSDTRTFVAGTMFVVRANLLKRVRELITFADFEPTTRDQTSTLAHEWERRLGHLVAESGMTLAASPRQSLFSKLTYRIRRRLYVALTATRR